MESERCGGRGGWSRWVACLGCPDCTPRTRSPGVTVTRSVAPVDVEAIRREAAEAELERLRRCDAAGGTLAAAVSRHLGPDETPIVFADLAAYYATLGASPDCDACGGTGRIQRLSSPYRSACPACLRRGRGAPPGLSTADESAPNSPCGGGSIGL